MKLLSYTGASRIGMILSALLITLLCNTTLNAQATDAWVDFNGPQQPANNYAGTYYVLLSDTINTSEIEVTLGTGNGLNDIMSYTFNYDVASGLPSGYSYTRNGNKLTLSIGSYTEYNTFFGAVRTKNTSGTWSSSFNFITN